MGVRWSLGRIKRKLRTELTRVHLYAVHESDATVLDRSDHPGTLNVLFLCHGNICRSPMAELYLRQRADVLEVDSLSVQSAGFVSTDGRPSPELAIETAREFGVDLTAHRSTTVRVELLAWGDATYLMDVQNYRYLQERFPDADADFLRPFGDGKMEIRDPVRGDRETFQEVYGEIATAVDGLLGQFRTRRET